MRTKFTPFGLRVCQFYWAGDTIQEIARRFSVPTSRVQALLATPEAKQILDALTEGTLSTMLEVNAHIQAAAPAIAQEKIRLALESPDERVRSTSCKDILEMAVGTPTKRVEIHHATSADKAREGMDEHALREHLRRKLGLADEPKSDLDPNRVLN